VDVDHCAHVITRSLALSEPSLFADARVANRKNLYVPAVTKRLFLVVRDWLRYRLGLRDSLAWTGRSGSQLLVNLLSDAHSRAGEDGKHHLLIEAYGYRWFRVGGLDYLLKRSDIDVDSRQKLR
jgi:hypothetical protein